MKIEYDDPRVQADPEPVMALGDWNTNADMIADVAKLGYLDGSVLDATYGEGNFWTVWRPEKLATNDLYKPAEFNYDYRQLPIADRAFDSVVFDPEYKLEGSPSDGNREAGYRYGVQMEKKNRQQRLDDIIQGARECYRVSSKWMLVKCMDQVEGGIVRWQTMQLVQAIEEAGGRLADEFIFKNTGRPQPPGRRQVTARRNYSWLLVFKRGKPSAIDRGLFP